MKPLPLQLLLLPILLSLGACRTPHRQTITQVATLDGLVAGEYDGGVTLGELAAHGDFGLGTYQAVDGEMVLLDGVFYQVKSDGTVTTPSADLGCPFAVVVHFEPNLYAELPSMDLDQLAKHLDEMIPDQSRFAAIRIDGVFTSMKTRSPAAQEKPYPPLAEVLKSQAVFTFENVEGTLVGFRCPPFVGGLNVPGYHFHFLTADRKAGGHVLSLEMSRGRMSADTVHETYTVLLTRNGSAGTE